jgi:hypothetical protein
MSWPSVRSPVIVTAKVVTPGVPVEFELAKMEASAAVPWGFSAVAYDTPLQISHWEFGARFTGAV